MVVRSDPIFGGWESVAALTDCLTKLIQGLRSRYRGWYSRSEPRFIVSQCIFFLVWIVYLGIVLGINVTASGVQQFVLVCSPNCYEIGRYHFQRIV